ncbi:MAG: tRNA (N6-threonylcarbamoyladenosine(37)-N6)-methyltransferase TrmO [Desulfobacteraceae bacterium]|jgi:tRNA-Thr(GGU) m(6)t(6)A37 methyltransferase TsaA
MRIEYRQIGTIHTPFKSIEGMPIQPAGAELVSGTVEVDPEYSEGLKDLDGFSHIILIYHFHKVAESKMIVTPFMDDQPRGVFATRAPKRPNPIGISVVRLLEIEGSTLKVENVDILDGTPLIDIKPYVPDFDQHPADRMGWLEHAKEGVKGKKSDGRFR